MEEANEEEKSGQKFSPMRMTTRLLSLILHGANKRAAFLATIGRRAFHGPREDSPDASSLSEQGRTSIAKAIFNAYRDPDGDTVNVGRLLAEIRRTGVRPSDRRLRGLDLGLRAIQKELGTPETSRESLELDMTRFETLIRGNLTLLTQMFCNALVVPDFEKFSASIKEIYEECKAEKGGKVANYIPQLSEGEDDAWGCAVCTVDGQRYTCHVKFSLQSCSKPFLYAICMNEMGCGEVHRYVGTEPSGRNFNEICLDDKCKPHNPMLNSGAILISSLILTKVCPELDLARKFGYMREYLECIAGYEHIGFNNSVFLSERLNANRNFAMAFYMKDNECFPEGNVLQDTMDLYFQSCSMELDVDTLAVMGATLANGGVCPTTWENVISSRVVRDVLSLMYSCGMYNYSGAFAFEVRHVWVMLHQWNLSLFQIGLPAKSGVSGALLIVIPNVLAVALYSPRLDGKGNSVRGVKFCSKLVDRFNFHQYDHMKTADRKMDPTKMEANRSMSRITLMFAAATGDVFGLQQHLVYGMDLAQADNDGRTPLHAAAMSGQLASVEFLIQIADAPANPTDSKGRTPADEAEEAGFTTVASYIRECAEFEVNSSAKKGTRMTRERKTRKLEGDSILKTHWPRGCGDQQQH